MSEKREREMQKRGIRDGRLQKNLQLLYPLEDWRRRQKEIYLKRIKETFFIGALILALYILNVVLSPAQKELIQDNRILRNSWEEGARSVRLDTQIQGEIQRIEVQVEPRSHTQEELENLFYDMLPVLENTLLGDNESAQLVSKPLQFAQRIEPYPFTLRYESSDYELVGTDGSIANSLLTEQGKEIWIGITATCEAYQKTYRMPLQILPPAYSLQEIQNQKLTDCVRQAENQNREAESFQLPKYLEGQELQWEEAAENKSKTALLGLLCLPLVWINAEQQINKEVEKRRKQLQRVYPDFIARMTLLLGTGMTVRGAFYKIMQEEEKRGKEVNYLLTELTVFCRALDAGEAEGQACLAFGKRCGLQQYRRAATLLVQNLKRGSKGLLTQLEYETHNALEEKKAQARQWGEEAGSKLLIPMILMLVVVMILIMVPAMGSFSF